MVSWEMKGIKMYYEYCNYNTQRILNAKDEMGKVFDMIDRGLSGFCTDIFQMREIAQFLPEGFVLAGPVDYPLGKSDRKVRQHEAITLLKSGANAIDLVCHRHYLMNNDWVSLKVDIQSMRQICKDYNATLRIVTNWQDDKNVEIFIQVVKLLRDYKIDFLIPSTAYHNDDFTDNLIVSHVVQEDTGVPTICNGYLYLDKHKEQLDKAEIFGFRFYPSNYKMVYK